jgi:hypothetical protein
MNVQKIWAQIRLKLFYKKYNEIKFLIFSNNDDDVIKFKILRYYSKCTLTSKSVKIILV